MLALARLYTERDGRAGEEQALLLLRSCWLEHPRDEDILRPLMELLGKRDCYQEALAYYEKLCRVLEEDGQQPDSHTQDVVAYIRTKQIQRTYSHTPVSRFKQETQHLSVMSKQDVERGPSTKQVLDYEAVVALVSEFLTHGIISRLD